MSEDTDFKIINERMPDDFEVRIKAILAEGGWRIAETEMSVTDHHYWAMLIRSNPSHPST